MDKICRSWHHLQGCIQGYFKGGKMTEKRYDEKQELIRLAHEHWLYISDLLHVHELSKSEIKRIGFHYKTAFMHGYKHAMEYNNSKPKMVFKELGTEKDLL